MKIKLDKLIIPFIFLLLLPASMAYYNSYECECHSHPTLSVTGSNQAVGEENCGRACGGLTTCPLDDYEDCTECCEESWCDKGESGLTSDNEVAGCMDSCVKTCESKMMWIRVYEAAKLIVIVFAAVMFAICGILFLISDDPESRNRARMCIMYAVFGLLIVGLAVPIIELIYTITLPAGVGPGISCASLIGDAIAQCYDRAMGGVDIFEYPCRNINVEACEGSVTEEDVEDYLDSIGRTDLTGTGSLEFDKIDWGVGTVSSGFGDYVCIKAHGNMHRDDPWKIKIEVVGMRGDEFCRSKTQIDLVGPLVRGCWNENEGSSEDVYCSSIRESVIEGWPDDSRVRGWSTRSYLKFNGEDAAEVDFTDAVTNTYGDDACITYDTFWSDEVFVSKASGNSLCRLHLLKSYIAPIAEAVLACWKGRPYAGDTQCGTGIDVSSWPPSSEVSVTEDDVKNYLEDVLNEPGVPVDFESGPISSDWGTDLVCIAYDDITAWSDDVDVVKTSENPTCGGGPHVCVLPEVLEVSYT